MLRLLIYASRIDAITAVFEIIKHDGTAFFYYNLLLELLELCFPTLFCRREVHYQSNKTVATLFIVVRRVCGWVEVVVNVEMHRHSFKCWRWIRGQKQVVKHVMESKLTPRQVTRKLSATVLHLGLIASGGVVFWYNAKRPGGLLLCSSGALRGSTTTSRM
eukprot:26840_3